MVQHDGTMHLKNRCRQPPPRLPVGRFMKFGHPHCSQRQAPVAVPEPGVRLLLMTQVYQYNIQNKGDGTRFVIYSMKKLNRVEQSDLLNKYMQGRTHLPTKLRHDIVVFDDRPTDMSKQGDVQEH